MSRFFAKPVSLAIFLRARQHPRYRFPTLALNGPAANFHATPKAAANSQAAGDTKAAERLASQEEEDRLRRRRERRSADSDVSSRGVFGIPDEDCFDIMGGGCPDTGARGPLTSVEHGPRNPPPNTGVTGSKSEEVWHESHGGQKSEEVWHESHGGQKSDAVGDGSYSGGGSDVGSGGFGGFGGGFSSGGFGSGDSSDGGYDGGGGCDGGGGGWD